MFTTGADGECGFVDKKTGKWIRGFEGVHRAHNRYGYKTRIMLRQQRKAKEDELKEKLRTVRAEKGDLRDKLNRLKARREEKRSSDSEEANEARENDLRRQIRRARTKEGTSNPRFKD